MIRLSRELNLLQHTFISPKPPVLIGSIAISKHISRVLTGIKSGPFWFYFIIISAAFTATDILKWITLIFLTFVLFLKIIFSRWSIWTNFLGNISLLGNLKNPKPYSSTSIRSTTTTLGWVMTNVEGLSLMKSDVPLIMWFFGVTWQNKNVMFPIPEDVGECYLPSNMSVWLRGYIMSCDKIKTLYLLEHL